MHVCAAHQVHAGVVEHVLIDGQEDIHLLEAAQAQNIAEQGWACV